MRDGIARRRLRKVDLSRLDSENGECLIRSFHLEEDDAVISNHIQIDTRDLRQVDFPEITRQRAGCGGDSVEVTRLRVIIAKDDLENAVEQKVDRKRTRLNSSH